MNPLRRSFVALGLSAVIGACAADASSASGDAVPASDDAVDTVPVDTAPADVANEDTASADAEDVATPPEDTLGPLALPLDDLCEPLAATVCQVWVGCRAATSSDSITACREHTAATCEASLDTARQRIASGTLRYDADAARACVTRVGLLACGPLDAMLAELGDDCATVFSGELAADATCAHAGDCASGLICVPDAGGACPGTCQAAPTAGEACDPRFAPCADGHLCELGACVADAVALDAVCVTDVQCPSDAFCDGDEAPARCHPRRAAGDPCVDDDACADGLFCSVADFADSGNCAPRLARDAACVPFVLGAQCADGQTCDGERERCVDRPRGVGDPCADDEQPCGIVGLFCDGATQTCAALPRIGEPCGGDGATGCQYGWCDADDGATGACRAFTEPGAACSGDRECGGLGCVDGVCGADPATACSPDRPGLALGPGFRLF